MTTLFVLTISCEHNIVFEKPMPPDGIQLNSMPEDLIGVFKWEEEERYLYLDERYIYLESVFTSTMSISEVRETETCNILDGGIYHDGIADCIPFEYIDEDSIISTFIEIDTLFNFGPEQNAKMYEGIVFLNFKNNNGNWATHILQPQTDGSLIWEVMHLSNNRQLTKEEIKDQKSNMGQDSTYNYIVNPTQKEFINLIQNGNTAEVVKLIPLNLEDELDNILIY